MVEFIFHIRYPASFFTVIDNLSRWRTRSHMQYYKYWLRTYGLTKKQRSLLDKYAVIRRKYPSQMEPIFMYADTLKDAWRKAGCLMKADEVGCLNEVFRAFKDTFDQEWQEGQYLYRAKERFTKMMERLRVDQMFEEVSHFFDIAPSDQKIDVHLLYNPSKQYGGGECRAGIQIQVRPVENETATIMDLAVIFHEAFHMVEPRERRREALRKLNLTDDDATVVREAVIGSLMPKGVMAKKYLQIGGEESMKGTIQHLQTLKLTAKTKLEAKNILDRLRRAKLTLDLLPLTESYIEEKKTVWDNYWKKAVELYLAMKMEERSVQTSQGV